MAHRTEPLKTAGTFAALSIATLLLLRFRTKKYDPNRKRLLNLQNHKGKPLVIAIDVGTSSIRASCFVLHTMDAQSDTVPIEKADWRLVEGSMQQRAIDCIDHRGEADIGSITFNVEELLDRIVLFLRVSNLQGNVVGLGFSTFAMNLLGVDEVGRPVTPIYTYAGRDPSLAFWARKLRKLLQKQNELSEYQNRTGTVVAHPAYAPCELYKLLHTNPTLLQSVDKWQSISAYLISRWTGRPYTAISYSEASWSGLTDFRSRTWDESLLRLLSLSNRRLPPLADSSISYIGLSSEYVERWPELQHVPLFLGIGDGAAANIGSKCVDNSRICVTIGTSAALRVLLPASVMADKRIPEGMWCYLISESQVLLGAALNDGGSLYQWIRDTFVLGEDDLQHVNQSGFCNHGLTILPFLRGERSPGWKEEATCTIKGITKWTKSSHILRAALESVCLRLKACYAELEPFTQPDAIIVASGAALNASDLWRQITADVFGKQVIVQNKPGEATSRGVAINIGVALGYHSYEDASWLHTDLIQHQPNAQAHIRYTSAQLEQAALYKNLYECVQSP